MADQGTAAAAGAERPAFNPDDHPHRRFNPLLGKHVLVSPHRTKRPWNGQVDEPVRAALPPHDGACYLCPGNARSGGHRNPQYTNTFVFENDFPALLPGALPLDPPPARAPSSIEAVFSSAPVRGRCSVLCFHARHDLTLARMQPDDVARVVAAWRDTYVAEGAMLRETGDEGYVQIFENRGSMMGASAPHPHGQVWALTYVPDEPASELAHLVAHAAARASAASDEPHHARRDDGACCLLCSYAAEEVARGERVVEIDEVGGWVAVVPFWATWPFEVMILPYKRHIPSLCQLSPADDASLARILRATLVRYDNLFSCPFPYSMGLHQSPLPPASAAAAAANPAHIHFHFYPPLLRSASVRKFLVGFEMMAESQRDLTPEQAAQRLRSVGSVHYLDKE